ncbi:peptidase M15 [Luteipulveratus halotolerans]|uniref:Peptidase M15 n=1 Tax=Luteipulveratus halotolerans TaxID=1631356 RepID=A0A0L6CPQ1_9MICO|nr:peptidase M15 [Luteipulveratus halotolerans]
MLVLLAIGIGLIGAVRSPSPSPSRTLLPWSPQVTSDATTASSAPRKAGTDVHDDGADQEDDVVDEEDGVVPDGTTVFSSAPAVARLHPALRSALRRAADGASQDGVRFEVNSGWRSPAYQEQLLREAVAKYGSQEKAARWVATPQTSPHVSGDAVDVGPSFAAKWLGKHGAAYGLCRVYDNEPWHFELRPDAVRDGCPGRYANPSQDPRLQ